LDKINKAMRPKILIGIILLLFVAASALFIKYKPNAQKTEKQTTTSVGTRSVSVSKAWIAPDSNSIPASKEGELIRYGRKLITHTSDYLGPKGKVAHISNGMNCQNCHLFAGTKSFGNNFSMVASGYPRFRPRSGRIESIEFRVNDCLERSLNGKRIDSLSKEMRAFVAYFKWIGKDVKKNEKIADAAVEPLPFMDRAADPDKGKILYLAKCKSCHGSDGQGIIKPDSSAYFYPPLWGKNSYNIGAGQHRLTRLAGFIKNNMPFGSTYQQSQLTNEQAWDVAAYISSQPRPFKDVSKDWPKMSTKPVDYPFGPYSNKFSEEQHQFGPFEPIRKADSLYAVLRK
jgi:thiosulfate dehydrogenase